MYERLPQGTLLLNRYKVKEIFSKSLVSSVYLAEDTKYANRTITVKEFLNADDDPDAKRTRSTRFQAEAVVLATLNHPAIPTLYEFAEVNDRAYLVSEFIDGTNWEHLIADDARPYDTIMQSTIDICAALEHIHTNVLPLLHRNIQPSNIIINKRGGGHLINFGISRVFEEQNRSVTIGTAGYTAPEQFDGFPTHRSDIYSLGASLHHLLTGRDPRVHRPFSFHDFPVREQNPDVPAGLASIVETAVAYNPEDRFASAEEMRIALQQVRDNPTADIHFKKRHIFISYSRLDTAMMTSVASDLRNAGVKVWTDEKLEPGTSEWQKAIAAAIEEASALVVLLSPDSKQSKWVERELSYAEGLNVRIFPLLVRGDHRSAVPIQVVDIQRIDVSNDYDSGIQELVAALRSYLAPNMG